MGEWWRGAVGWFAGLLPYLLGLIALLLVISMIDRRRDEDEPRR